jgi:hypothetical protein
MLEIFDFSFGRRAMYCVNRTIDVVVRALFAVIVISAIGMSAANAQSLTPAGRAFLANPTQLLQQYPDGGSPLANIVQQLALSDFSTFKVLLGLLASANDPQKRALGEGLAQAAKIEVLTNQPLAEDWQNQIAAIADPIFSAAATNVFGDVQLGVAGGGPLGGPLGGAGQGPTGAINSSPVQNIQANPVNTPAFNITSTTTAAGGAITFTTTNRNTTTRTNEPPSTTPVSPAD